MQIAPIGFILIDDYEDNITALFSSLLSEFQITYPRYKTLFFFFP